MGHRIEDGAGQVARVECTVDVSASRSRCFDAFVNETAEWFYETEATRQSRRAVLEPTLGGRFFIRSENGDENLLALVTMLKRDRELRLRGDFTIPQAFVANVTVRFDDAEGGTRISVEHRMAGEFDDDLPAGFDEGWTDGLEKLKRHVETSAG
jgi:uncharacterized protein YndB with AHSA1/START domain